MFFVGYFDLCVCSVESIQASPVLVSPITRGKRTENISDCEATDIRCTLKGNSS